MGTASVDSDPRTEHCERAGASSRSRYLARELPAQVPQILVELG
ncbi:hypothetical protein [Nocardioides lijunqiniae]|nr:hypothetical protein [Nocardioides lijunqiniae]